MFRYAWHLLGRREDAEDASQATFLAVHRALGDGTAVLEPGAWVLRIARNECLGRLRQRARVPGSTPLDGVEPPAVGGLERLAEVRDQMRVARATLRALPVPEREAFVLREWLGLGTAEVALAMSMTPGEIEMLTGRARRSLVLAVGGLEPASGCADTRAGLEAGSIGRAGTVHLLRCPTCRGVRRALRPPEASAGGREPVVVVGQRLAGALPGFASGGGGIVAVLTAKAAAAPLLAKTAAIVTAALVTAGVARHAVTTFTPSRHAAAAVPARGGEARSLVHAPTATVRSIARAPVVPAAPVVSQAPVRPRAQVVDLRVATVRSGTRGGAAVSVGGRAASTSHSSIGAQPGAGRVRKDGAVGGSGDGGRSEHGTTSSSDKSREDGSASDSPATTTGTGRHEDRSPNDGSGQSGRSRHDARTPSDGSTNGSRSGDDGSATPGTAVATHTTGDESSQKGDGTHASDPSSGDGGSDGSAPPPPTALLPVAPAAPAAPPTPTAPVATTADPSQAATVPAATTPAPAEPPTTPVAAS